MLKFFHRSLAGICFLSSFLFCSCEVFESERSSVDFFRDTIPPVIFIEMPVDTAYLYTIYNANDVRVLDNSKGNVRCNGTPLKVSGDLNINLAGTYYLHYDATDESGNAAATVTRTVHVVENRSAFLNGSYDVACSCTTTSTGTNTQTINSVTFQAEVYSEPVNGFFKIISVFVGRDHVAVSTRLYDSLFDIGFLNPDYHNGSRGTGTLSTDKNSFLIETVAYNFLGEVFKCSSNYRRKLIIRKEK
jgi:hypothetical protein